MLADLGYAHVAVFGGLLDWTGALWKPDDDPDEVYDDDYYGARYYVDPEEFYEDFYDDFGDYEEAEEYFYEYGG